MSAAVRVLVVDDEKLIRWSVSERLARQGYQVECAESAEQALELLAASPPSVMLLDVRLPGLDGVAALQRALGLCPELVVVMMSAHSSIDVAVDAMKQGAADFLVKPFPFSALDSAVSRAATTARLRRGVAVREDPPGHELGLGALVGDSPQLQQLREVVARIARSNAATALIEGESGSGKEVVAKAIHYESARARRPFLQLNCAALPEQLLESELFGHERGAFTDARSLKAGLFEAAAGGSVMLDEIGDLPPGGQAKLLLLLENKTFRRLGGLQELRADVRVIAATNVDLERRVAEGRFRADLYFRLNVVRLTVPPLRERRADLPVLSSFFIARYNQEMSRAVRGLSAAALDRLLAHSWPGNVRELRNVIERAFILHPEADELRPEHLPQTLREQGAASSRAGTPLPGGMNLDEVERRLIGEALEKTRGNQSQAARMLGISRDTLRYRLKKLELE